jgi:non-ribosomal peptide synthetase component F
VSRFILPAGLRHPAEKSGGLEMGWLADETGLDKCAANFVPLTPLSHLKRAAEVHGARTALVWGSTRRSYAQYHARVSCLASALAGRGVKPGDVVATLLPNIPAQAEAHFGVPASRPSPTSWAMPGPEWCWSTRRC